MNSLTELKKTIHSLNETITDHNINVFKELVSQLGIENKENPTVVTFLKMMRSLGRYLSSKKDKAHVDSIPVLNSLGEQLEKIIHNPDLEKEEIHRILSEEIQKFTALKNKLGSRPSIPEDDLNALKAVILAIDWEISNATLQSFETVTSRLLKNLENYKIHHTFLKIIHSLGCFIGRQKANAPTDSISFLRSVFAKFEQIVQTPDMTFKDKKYLLGIDINRFHEFKQKIYKRAPSPPPLSADPSYDESIQPALSHIKKAGMIQGNEQMPLTTLRESDDGLIHGKEDPGTITPALADKKESPANPKDIMDDLFNTKESPADELLDAIHLQEMNGPDKTEEPLSSGIKNLTPRRLDNEPIPEIGDRLDEFFNLDLPAEYSGAVDDTDDPAVDLTAITQEDTPPFQEENDSFTQGNSGDILAGLKAAVTASEWLQNESSLMSINRDISALEKLWENDIEKKELLSIISRLINGTKKEVIKKEDMSKEKSSGILGKIKATFTS